jgi:glucosyl-3-phosphoglycerate synthase
MSPRYSTRLFRKILVPVIHGSSTDSALNCALNLADPESILLAGIVGMPLQESLSAAAEPARHARKELRDMAGSSHVRFLRRIHASHKPWEELLLIVNEEQPDLLVIETAQLGLLNVTAGEAFRYPPCDMMIAGGVVPQSPARVLVSLRGGPSAELSLRLGLAISRTSHAKLTALHISSPSSGQAGEAAFKGVDKVLKNLPEVERRHLETDDPTTAIREASRGSDLLVIGATVRSQTAPISIGPVADLILRETSGGVLVAKSRRPLPSNMDSEAAGQNAISVLVDKWFAENTYHASEFADLKHLLGQARAESQDQPGHAGIERGADRREGHQDD